MGIKDFVYLGLIALSAIVFYLHGLYSGPTHRRGKRKLDVPFNDSECLTELPAEPVTKASAERVAAPPSPSQDEIRQTFGNN